MEDPNEIDSVASYVKYVLEMSNGRGELIYRGLPNREYKLIPSIGRHVKWRNDDPVPKEVILDRERHVLEYFRNTSVPFRNHREVSELDVMVLAQHHGIPTRLLDWTLNPLIALYFAARGADGKFDGIVYMSETPTPLMAIPGAHLNPRKIGQDVYFSPQHIDQRIAAQSSIFTLHADPTVALESETMEHIWFKGSCKEKLLAELDVLGVHGESIFPGLGGISDRIRGKYFGMFN